MTAGPILVTGATGFIGRAMTARLRRDGRPVRGTARRAHGAGMNMGRGMESERALVDLTPDACWQGALDSVTVVVHTAARVHQMQDRSADPLAEYRRINTEGTLNLARQAAAAGVRRFIFLSTIKVLGEQSPRDRPLRADDPLRPQDPYAVSKAETEQGLLQLAATSAMELVIIRPPLVYGPGVGANFLAMMRWLSRGYPLPLAGIDNRRSLVALGNLVDLLAHCCDHPAAAGRAWHVTDGEDLSTPQLLRRLGEVLGKETNLWRAPPGTRLLARLLGKETALQRLTQSLCVDAGPTTTELGWTPPLDVDRALRQTADWFRSRG